MKTILRLIPLCLCMCMLLVRANAQERTLTVTTKANNDRSVDFSATKTDPGTYSVILSLSNVNNASAPARQVFNVNGYGNSFYTLRPVNKEQGVNYSLSYSYIRGKLNPKYDPEFVYLLPYKNGTQVLAAESGYAHTQYFGSTTPEDWKSYRFYTKTADSITAVRKGTVVEVKDLYESEPSEGVAFTSKVNGIIIEHPDGTLAHYRGFKKGSITVKVGDVVFPGTTLGLNSKSSTNSDYNVSLLFSYLKSADIESTRDKNVQDYKSLYGFLTTKFHTAENPSVLLVPRTTYTVSSTPEIVQKEMTKKELKAVKK